MQALQGRMALSKSLIKDAKLLFLEKKYFGVLGKWEKQRQEVLLSFLFRRLAAFCVLAKNQFIFR